VRYCVFVLTSLNSLETGAAETTAHNSTAAAIAKGPNFLIDSIVKGIEIAVALEQSGWTKLWRDESRATEEVSADQIPVQSSFLGSSLYTFSDELRRSHGL
jgi:hypothetical protein